MVIAVWLAALSEAVQSLCATRRAHGAEPEAFQA
jgi:hypothetical protein